MKFLSLLALLFGVNLALVQANPADSRGGAKITRNEAEHIALRDHNGARVTAANLETVKGRMVWSIDVMKPKGRHVMRVSVDAMSGRFLGEKKGGRGRNVRRNR